MGYDGLMDRAAEAEAKIENAYDDWQDLTGNRLRAAVRLMLAVDDWLVANGRQLDVAHKPYRDPVDPDQI